MHDFEDVPSVLWYMCINGICKIFLITFNQHTDETHVISDALQIAVSRAEIFIEPFKMMIVPWLVTFSGRQERYFGWGRKKQHLNGEFLFIRSVCLWKHQWKLKRIVGNSLALHVC